MAKMSAKSSKSKDSMNIEKALLDLFIYTLPILQFVVVTLIWLISILEKIFTKLKSISLTAPVSTGAALLFILCTFFFDRFSLPALVCK